MMPLRTLLEAGGCKYADEMRCIIISGQTEGADRPTEKPKSSCACEAVNAPVIRCLHAMRRGCGNANRKAGGAKK